MHTKTTMKTKNMTLFAVAFAIALVMNGFSAKAAVPTINVCAQQMCFEMRNCGGQGKVQKPTGQKDVVVKSAADSKAKSAESVQGVAASCNMMAWQNYQACIGFDKAPDTGNKDKDVTPNNSVTPTTNQK